MTRRRISARLREDAAVACAQMATWYTADRDVAGHPPIPSPAVEKLSDAAWYAARKVAPLGRNWIMDQVLCWATAESLLRTGWVP